jgi:hypothetical protein
MDQKFFVTVIASDPTALRRLAAYDLDLLHQTSAAAQVRSVRATTAARAAAAASAPQKPPEVSLEFSIDGLLTMDQVARLVADGYEVVVREPASKRARANQIMDFQEWLKAVLEK